MRINKDLAEAVLMLSCISLVLVGTTEFDSSSNKTIIMIVLAILAVYMAVARFMGGKKQPVNE